MATTAPLPALVYFRDAHGAYYTDRVGLYEFEATIDRIAAGWYLRTYTFGGLLSATEHRTLAAAKAAASRDLSVLY
jgi:hypothetical protein